jgi:hypothetical protein
MEEMNRREAIVAALAAGLTPVLGPDAPAPAEEVPAEGADDSSPDDDSADRVTIIITN